jgi:hypothetical protein
MSGLVLKLAPHEQVYINGALVQNGDKRTRLIMPNMANVLRVHDCMDESRSSESPWHRLHCLWQRVVAGVETDPETIINLACYIRERMPFDPNANPYLVLKMIKEKIAEIP